MPFLIIISIGVVLVLAFNLWTALFVSESPKAAYMHVVEGSVEMKTWGTDDFFSLSTDALVMQGDEIRSFANAKIIFEFFDGTIMRVDGGSDIRFESIDDESKVPEIEVRLVEGNLWFNKVYKDTVGTNLVVNLDNVVVRSNLASVFAVESESGLDQIVRVFGVFDNEGLLVEVLNEDRSTVIETENIGIGQEIIFSKEVLSAYWQYQSPTVLSGVSDEFKQSSWFLWNVEEDQSPTEFEKYVGPENAGLVKVEPEVIESNADGKMEGNDEVFEPEKPEDLADDLGEAAEDATEDASKDEPVEEKAAEVNLGSLTKPTITSVSGGSQVDENGVYKVAGNPAILNGTVSGAAKVVVNGYTLQKFNPGDTTWTYFANADYGLMKEGENIYEAYAVDANGNKSESLIIKVYYAPPSVALAPEADPKPEAAVSTAVVVSPVNPENSQPEVDGAEAE